jgi:hypothetical protein
MTIRPIRLTWEWASRALLGLAVFALLGLAAAMGWLSSQLPSEGAIASGTGHDTSIPDQPAHRRSPIDHSVVESVKPSDEPDLTGASIAAY